MPAPLPFNFYDLIETFPQSGCAICNRIEHDIHRFLDSMLYEYVIEPQLNTAFREARGLCAQHSSQLIEFGASVLGIAILEAAVLDEVLKLSAGPLVGGSAFARLRGATSGAALADRLDPAASCPACDNMRKMEELHTQALAEHIEDERLQTAYRQSEGLCLPHFQLVLRAARGEKQVKTLLGIQQEHWRKLKAELDLFAEKYDTNKAGPMGVEGDSWRRALRNIAGFGSIFGVRGR